MGFLCLLHLRDLFLQMTAYCDSSGCYFRGLIGLSALITAATRAQVVVPVVAVAFDPPSPCSVQGQCAVRGFVSVFVGLGLQASEPLNAEHLEGKSGLLSQTIEPHKPRKVLARSP